MEAPETQIWNITDLRIWIEQCTNPFSPAEQQGGIVHKAHVPASWQETFQVDLITFAIQLALTHVLINLSKFMTDFNQDRN